MSKEGEPRAGTRIREKLREQFDLPIDWPLKFDPVTLEFYYPIDRYLEQLRRRTGNALFATIHSVIDAERRDWK